MSDIGHNSGIVGEQLNSFVDRIERLNTEKTTIGTDIKSVFEEAKSSGYDVKILRKVIALRKREASEIEEEEALISTYLHALGGYDALD